MGNDSDDILFWYEAPIAGITGIEDIISTEIVVIVLECMIDDGITGHFFACFPFQYKAVEVGFFGRNQNPITLTGNIEWPHILDGPRKLCIVWKCI